MSVAVLLITAFGLLGSVAGGGWLLFHEPWRPETCWDCVLLKSHRHNGERPPHRSLLTLADAQEDFRANDRDGDGKQEYWRPDVAGLYLLVPPGTTERIKLIEISIAGADAAAKLDVSQVAVKAPKAGTWFKAIRHLDEEVHGLNPLRFACCAFPDSPQSGRWMYVLDERRRLYRAPMKKGGVDHFPDPKSLREEWEGMK